MKFFNISILVTITVIFMTTASGEEDAAPKRSALLRRPNARPGPLGKATTTTTAVPASEDGDFADEEYDQSEDGPEKEPNESTSTTTTSTEPPKKIGPIIRPFRSNEDLLNALKRRQTAKKGAKVEKPTAKPNAQDEGGEDEEDAPAAAPAKSSSVGKRRFGRQNGSTADHFEQSAPEDEQFSAPAKKPLRISLRPARN